MKIPYFCCIGAELKRYQKDFDFMNQVYLYKIPTDDTLEEVLTQDYFQAIADTVLQDDLLYIYEPTAQALHMCRFNKQGGHITAVQLSNNVPGLTANRVLISDSTGHIAAGDVTLDYLKNKVNLDGTSTMTGPLKMRSSVSFKCAIAPSWDGVGFYKLNDNGSVTLMASMEAIDGLTPATDNTYNIGKSQKRWKDAHVARVITSVINNGHDIAVPVTSSADTLALKSEVDNAANSGRMITDTGVWYAKMYSASTVPTGAEYDGTNYADFSQTDGDGNPVIKIYTGVSGAWTLTDTITPPDNYDGYVPVTKKMWDIIEQTGQQGGRVLWNHQSKEFTPYPNIVDLSDVATTDLDNLTPTGEAKFTAKANTDLSNLTSTGKNIGNWSSNVSNCITNIPQDIKLELDTATHSVILKAGSKVYVPNDIDVYNELVIASDLTLGPVGTATTTQLLYVKSDGTQLLTAANSVSGTTAPADGIFWNTSTNKIMSRVGGADGVQCSIPIAQIHRTSGNWDSIKIEFNGFGYMGSTSFVLPGVSVLIPDYRNDDGTLKSIQFTTTAVSTNTETGTGQFDFLISGTGALVNSAQRIYDATRNVVYSVVSDVTNVECFCGKYTRESGVISNFYINPVFHALDYSKAGSCCLPTNKKYIDITRGASGTKYIAPADGWIYVRMKASAVNQYVALTKAFPGNITIEADVMWSQSATADLYINMPVSRGEQFGLSYSAAGTSAAEFFRFVPANAATEM